MFEFFAAIGEWYAKTKWIQNVVTAVQIITAVMGVKGFLQAKNMLGKGQDILANKTSAGGKIPVIYGTRRVGAQIVYMDVSGNDSRDLYVVYALSVGEVDEIIGKTIELDGNRLTDSARFRDGGYIGSDKISSGSGSLNTVSQNGTGIDAGAGQFGSSPTSKYRYVMNLHHGAASQTADPMLVASMPNWTSAHKLNGIAYIAAHYGYDKEGIWSGVPQLTVQVRGKKVYDPRSGETAFTDSTGKVIGDNPALCFLDYITNDEYGKGLTTSQINMTTFGAAATVCETQVDQPYFNGTAQSLTWSGTAGDDFITISGSSANAEWYQNKIAELIDLFDANGNGVLDGVEIKDIQRTNYFGSTENFRIFFNGTLGSTYSPQTGTSLLKVKRFQCNGYLDTNKNVMENAKELLANMRGIFLYIDGKYELSIEDTGTSTFSINDNHIISDAGISVDYGNKDKKANKVIVEFFNANKKYELDTATVLHDASPEYYSDDGDEILEIKAEFPYITDPYIAYNMGKAILTRSRNQTTMQFLGTPEMYKLNVGDIVDLTYAGLGFSGKVCRVEALELQPNGLVAVSLIEYFDVYTWEVPPQEPVEELANLPSAYAVKAPTNITFTDTDSSSTSRPFLSWDEPTDFPDYQYRVNVVDNSGNQVINRIVDVENCDLNFVPTGSYVANITSLNTLGTESSPARFPATGTFNIGDAPTDTADIQNDAITTPKILDDAVTDAKINSLSANKITAGTIDASVITVTNLDADNITSGTLDADTVTVSGGDVTINSSGITINGSSSSINLGSGAFTVSSAGVMTATGATISGNLTATSLNVTGATVTGTLDASTITLNGDPLDDLFGVAGSGSAKTLSIGHDTKNQLKVDGTQMIYTAYDSLQSDGDDALIMNHGSATFYSGSQSTGWQTTTIYAGDESTAGGILTDRVTIDATATNLNSSYRFYVNGEAFFDDPLILDTVSTPSTTTNKLYNVGGTLYWNGNSVNTGAGDITGVTITTTGGSLTGGAAYTSGDATFTLDIGSTITGAKTFDNNVVIQGNLDVQGTTTTIDTTNLDVKDKNITLNYGTGDTSANANGAGITIQDAVNSTTDATLTWNTSNDSFNFSHPVNVTGTVTATDLLIDTDVIVTDSTNDRVGINKTSPATTLDVGGSVYFSGILRATSDGSESSPTIQAGADADTGLYRPTANHIGFTTAGTNALTLDSSQNATFAGTINSGAITADGLTVDTTTLVVDSTNNRVGIGTTSIDEKLHIEGSVNNDDIAIKIKNTYDDNLSTSRPAAALLFQAASTNAHLRVFGAPADTAANHQIDLGSTASGSFITFSPASTEAMRINSTAVDVNVFLDLNDNYITGVNSYRNVNGTEIIDANNTSYTILKSYAGVNRLWLGESATYLNNTNFYFRDTGSNHLVTINSTGLDIRSGGLDINSLEVIDSSRNLTNIGTISSGQLNVNAGATNTTAVFESTDDKAFIQIKDNDTNAHLIAKDGNFSIADDSETFDTFRIDLDTGNVDISGTFDSGAITTTGDMTIQSTGSVGLTINADTDNATESDVPYLSFKMDGSRERLRIGVDSSNEPYISTDSDIGLPLNIKTGVANTTAMRFESNQNIGIPNGYLLMGTDSGDPFNSQSVIRIQDGGNAYIQMKTSTTTAGGVLVGDTDDDFVGGFIYSNSLDALSLYSGNAVAITIDTNQNSQVFGNINLSSGHSYKIDSTTVIDSALNLTNINTISSGAITSTGDISGATIEGYTFPSYPSQSGGVLTSNVDGDMAWSFNTISSYVDSGDDRVVTSTGSTGIQGEYGLTYNRTDGLKLQNYDGTGGLTSSATLTLGQSTNNSGISQLILDSQSQGSIAFKDGTTTDASISYNGAIGNVLSITCGNGITFGSSNLDTTGTISSGAITSTGASSFTDLAIGGAADSNYDLKVYGLARFQSTANFVSSGNVIQIGGTTILDSDRNLDNINSLDVTSTTSDLNKFTFTDTNSNATFTGLTLDFNASGSQAHTTDRTHRALFVDFDTSQTGGNTTDENRAYGIHVDVRGTGDTDLRYGVYSYAETQHSSGTVTSNVGVYAFAAADDTGTGHTTNNYGVHGLAYGYNSGTGGTTNHYAGYFKTLLTTANDKNTSTAHGVYAEVEIDNPGQAQTVSNVYGVRSIIDNDSAGNVTMSNAYLFFGDYQGTIPSGGYGLYIGDNVPNYVGGEIRSANNITAYYSDERLKDFHGKINNPIDKVKQLNGYYFTENKKAKELGYNNDKQQVGVNAQEVQKVLPEVVDIAPISHKEDVNEEYLTVHYDKLVPLLIEAIKEQQQQIDELKARLDNDSSK